MAKAILIEEFHLSVYAPRGLPESQYAAMRRTLNGRRFQSGLRRAVQGVVLQHPALTKVRVTLSR